MTTPKAFDRKHQRANKRKAIIREAAIVFNESGYEGTSLDEIAGRLGVTKKALYYYVKNKNDILQEIFRQWLETQERAIAVAEQQGSTGIERLEIYARNYVTTVVTELTPMDRITGEISSLDAATIEEIQKRRKKNDKKLAAFVQAAIDENEAAAWDPRFVVYVLNGALDWMFKWFRQDGPLSPDQAVDKIMAVIMGGVKVR